MSNNNKAWNTKYGPRRVRNEAPDIGEAIAAARGLSDNIEEQADIAAGLIGLPREVVMAEIARSASPRKGVATVALSGRGGAERTVIVQRKRVRKFAAGARPVLLRKPGSAG